MNKTLRKKLTADHANSQAAIMPGNKSDDILTPAPGINKSDMGMEINLLQEAAKDLLQPRPEVIARILRLAKEI